MAAGWPQRSVEHCRAMAAARSAHHCPRPCRLAVSQTSRVARHVRCHERSRSLSLHPVSGSRPATAAAHSSTRSRSGRVPKAPSAASRKHSRTAYRVAWRPLRCATGAYCGAVGSSTTGPPASRNRDAASSVSASPAWTATTAHALPSALPAAYMQTTLAGRAAGGAQSGRTESRAASMPLQSVPHGGCSGRRHCWPEPSVSQAHSSSHRRVGDGVGTRQPAALRRRSTSSSLANSPCKADWSCDRCQRAPDGADHSGDWWLVNRVE